MNLVEAVKNCLSNYANFGDRASRSEYWWFTLFWFLCGLLAAPLGDFVGVLVGLALLLPTLAVQIRRLHDIGKSGWWILIFFIPILGVLILFYFSILPSDGPNEYGQGPLAA